MNVMSARAHALKALHDATEPAGFGVFHALKGDVGLEECKAHLKETNGRVKNFKGRPQHHLPYLG